MVLVRATTSSAAVSEGPRHLEAVDRLRGVAILLVLACHAYTEVFPGIELGWRGWVRSLPPPGAVAFYPAMMGHLGVAVFFAISGFCIHLSFARGADGSWGTFGLRRFFRIYPPYLLCLLVFAFGRAHGLAWDWRHMATHLMLIHNVSTDHVYHFNPSFWSIATEVQLYAIYPLGWWMARRWGWGRALGVAAVCEALGCGVAAVSIATPSLPELSVFVWTNPFSRWLSWMIGAAVAERHLRGEPRAVPRRALWWLAGGVVVAELVLPFMRFAFTFAALLTAGLIANSLAGKRAQPARPAGAAGRALAWVGTVSYSLYLIHQPLLHRSVGFVERVTGPAGNAATAFAHCAIAYVPIVGAAWVLHRLVERPSIAAGKLAVAALAGRRGY